MSRSRPIVLGLLFLSGFTGLVYEWVWFKRLTNLLGATGQVQTIVLAMVLVGIAGGAWLLGRAADRSARPLALFGILQLGIGAYALGFHRMLEALRGIPAGPMAKLLVAALCLLPPTVLIGGSIPTLMRYFAARRQLPVLYAVHSLGGALGCLFAGVGLIPSDGLLRSEWKAAAINFAVGAAAIGLGLRNVPRAATDLRVRAYSPFAVRIAQIAIALSGFTASIYLTHWFRILSGAVGATTYAFTFILTAFLLGIGLGSAWLSRRDSEVGEPDGLALFAKLQLLLTASVCLALPVYGQMPKVFFHLQSSLRRSDASWPLHQWLTFVFCVGVLLVPTFFLGTSFPVAARVALNRVETVGAQLGVVYLWQGLGAGAGVLLVGLEGSLALGLGCNVLAAGIAWYASNPSMRRVLIIAAATVAGAALGFSSAGRQNLETSTDLDTQILAAHLGVLTHPGEVKRVLLVGGDTGSLLTHPIERLDLVTPRLVVVGDPRCKVHLEDAKAFLLLSPEKYDLIVSPSVYSRDFFQIASAHLAPGGRLVGWFRADESSDALVRLRIRTVRDTFAHGTSWLGAKELVWIASADPQSLDADKISRRMARPEVKADLLKAKTPDVATLLAGQVHSDEGQLLWAGKGPINSDDRDLLEYESPRASYRGEPVDLGDERRNGRPSPLSAGQAENIYRSYAWVHPPGDSLVRNAAKQWLALAPDNVDAALAVAQAHWAQRDIEAALAILDPLIASGLRRPDCVALWLDARARQARRAAAPWHPIDLSSALAIGREALEANPTDSSLERALKEASP